MSVMAFIDSFINDPVYNCVNEFSERTKLPVTYHQVSKFGTKSLYALEKPLGVVLLGSASHVHEKFAWHEELRDYIRFCINHKVPILGICFGHQLLVDMFGGEVSYLPDKKNFNGVRELKFCDKLWGWDFGDHISLSYAHEQLVTQIPSSFKVMASSGELKFEILKHSELEIYTTQAHPEASLSYLEQQTQDARQVKQYGNLFLDSFYAHCKKLDSETQVKGSRR